MIRPSMPAPAPRPLPIAIGWKEYVDLPELGVYGLKAKVDTGARTSSLHVCSLAVREELPDGSQAVELTIALAGRGGERRVTSPARVLRRIRVTDSGGHPEVRPVIETELVLGPVRKRILVTLTDRSGMLFRMILGRKAIEREFLVDAGKKYLLGRRRPARPRREPAAV
jgi:hypothetical protein